MDSSIEDREWVISDGYIIHMCNGDPKDPHRGKSTGFWPTKDNKCMMCEKEIPKHLRTKG